MVDPLQIITHRSKSYGSGHWTRSQALAKQLRSSGRNVEVLEFFDFVGSREGLARRSEPKILDLPFGLQPLATKAQISDHSVALDWVYESGVPRVNIAAFASPLRSYPSLERTFHGLDYIILPESDESSRIPEGEDLSLGEKDLPVVLGSNPNSASIESAVIIAQSLGLSPIVFGHSDRASQVIHGVQVRFPGFTPNLFSRLRNARVSITSGGVALTESLAQGLFTIAIPATVDEYFFASKLTEVFGGVVSLDATGIRSIETRIQKFENAGLPSFPKHGVRNVAAIVEQAST